MSRITKQIATSVANQLVLSRNQDLKKEQLKLSEIVTSIYLSKIPDEVMEFFKLYPVFFKTKGGIKLNGNGFNYEFFPMTKNVPDNNDSYCGLFSKEDCDKIKNQWLLIQKLQAENDKLHFDIETALVNYRTYSNIEKEFPEAFKLLPARQITALVVNIKDIRCKLDKANC